MNPLVNPVLNVLTVMPLTVIQFICNVKILDVKKKALYLISVSFVCALVMYLNCIGIINNGFRVFVVTLLYLFYSFLYIKEHFVQAFVWGGLNLIVIYCCEGVCGVIIFLIAGESYYILMQEPILLILIRAGYLGIYFIFINILSFVWSRMISKKHSGFLMFIPLIAVQIIFFYACLTSFWNRAMTFWTAIIVFSISLLNIFLDWLMYILLKEANQKELESNKAEQLQIQLHHQKNRADEIEEERKKASLIKGNILLGLSEAKAVLKQRNGEKAAELLASINEQISHEYLYSNNHVADAVVSEKAKICKEKQIKLITEMDVPREINIKNAELCVIFANLLDNAIRACENENCLSPEIRLAARERGGYLVIRQENTFDGNMENRKKGYLSEHGLGLGIVEQIAEKYEGSLKTESVDGKFITVVMIKM